MLWKRPWFLLGGALVITPPTFRFQTPRPKSLDKMISIGRGEFNMSMCLGDEQKCLEAIADFMSLDC